jgi:hypothetical protein
MTHGAVVAQVKNESLHMGGKSYSGFPPIDAEIFLVGGQGGHRQRFPRQAAST